MEYTGEVINFVEFQRRVRYYNKMKQPHHYFMSVAPDFIIDSGIKGNWSRFVNHSCEPNAETEKVRSFFIPVPNVIFLSG